MKKFSTLIITLLTGLIILLSAGCSAVTTMYPLSENPEPIDKDKLEGSWLLNNEVFQVKFASNGVAQIAAVQWKSNQFQIVHAEMTVTKGDKHNFFSLRSQEDGKWMDKYYLLQYMVTQNNDLVVWNANVDEFENIVKSQILPGTIQKNKSSTIVSITNAPTKLLKLINGPENIKLFDYKSPIILRKINNK